MLYTPGQPLEVDTLVDHSQADHTQVVEDKALLPQFVQGMPLVAPGWLSNLVVLSEGRWVG